MKEGRDWKDLAVDFTQATTLHGIRFVTEDTKYLTRRLVDKSYRSF